MEMVTVCADKTLTCIHILKKKKKKSKYIDIFDTLVCTYTLMIHFENSTRFLLFCHILKFHQETLESISMKIRTVVSPGRN